MQWHRRKLLISIPLMLFLLLAFYLAKEFMSGLQINCSAVEVNSDPTAFVLAYDLSVNQPLEPFAFGTANFWPPSGWEAYSPLFPYRTLKQTYVQTEPCRIDPDGSGGEIVSGEDRSILTDSLWDISWIYVAKCQQGPLYFGPYRFTQAL